MTVETKDLENIFLPFYQNIHTAENLPQNIPYYNMQ